MASFTSRIAGWTAGRLKGEKARKKTMDWMQKTGVGQLLGVAGDAALVGGALKGAGALKGLITGGAGGAAPVTSIAAPMIDTPVPESVLNMGASAPVAPPLKPMPTMGGATTAMAPRAAAPVVAPPMEAPGAPSRLGEMFKGGAKKVGQAATAAGRFAKENVAPLSYGASALSESLASSRKTALEEEQMRLEQERRNRLAELLMPLFQSEIQQYGARRQG
jgi:hypothetical protein